MKTLAAALLVSLAASSAHADALDFSPARTARLDRAHARVVKGQVLTGLAIGFLATGMALGIASAVAPHGVDNCGATCTPTGGGLGTTGLAIGSALTTVAGIGLAAGGIPTWALGARDVKRATITPGATAFSIRF